MSAPIELCYRQFGLRIEQMRNVLGWTQAELAAKVGLERTSITNLEAGRQRVQLHVVERFAKEFGCAPKHMMKGIWT